LEHLFDHGLTVGHAILLFGCIACALAFEFANGFHDTANAVATVIYTNSLRPRAAVVLSGIMNFLGVFAGGIAVAMGIIHLLPVELVVAGGAAAGLAMVLALLLSAILWNVGTWYLGLPASSSHTLIGAILGVGLANSLLPGHVLGDGVNWKKATDIGTSLLVSPLFGFCAAAALLLLVRRFARDRSLLEAPKGDAPPPRGTRALLIGTCAAVSFAHGSNDGQKGVGLLMLILIGIVPAGFSLDMDASAETLARSAQATVAIEALVRTHCDAHSAGRAKAALAELAQVRARLEGRRAVSEIPREQRFAVRQAILLAERSLDALAKTGGLGLTPEEAEELARERAAMRAVTEYAPTWVLLAIALSLGVGTMVGWKRIVVTVGERIGKSHLTCAQGASAEVVAASTIGLAALAGLPVSTTHVLSSGVAGTMVASGSGIQRRTVERIALAWLLTLPASMLLSGAFYLALRAVLLTWDSPMRAGM
jgi:PiT family inorganic phosphate transporter